jgi:hypothetical protein
LPEIIDPRFHSGTCDTEMAPEVPLTAVSRRAKRSPIEWVLAGRNRSVVAFDRQHGPDRTERRSLQDSAID